MIDRDIADIIASLRSMIDQLNIVSDTAKDQIFELARRYDENEHFERSQICRTIKELLRDKIEEGKVTEKWIEECLPSEYKRKYTKSEPSSHSLDKAKEKVLLSNGGESQDMEMCLHEENEGNSKPELDNDTDAEEPHYSSLPKTKALDTSDLAVCPKCPELLAQNEELKQALSKSASLRPAYRMKTGEETEFQVAKEQLNQVVIALQSSKEWCYLVFAQSGILVRVEDDVSRKDVVE